MLSARGKSTTPRWTKQYPYTILKAEGQAKQKEKKMEDKRLPETLQDGRKFSDQDFRDADMSSRSALDMRLRMDSMNNSVFSEKQSEYTMDGRETSTESFGTLNAPIFTEGVSTAETRALLRARLGLPAKGQSLLEAAEGNDAIYESEVENAFINSGASTPKSHTSSIFIDAAARGDVNAVHEVLLRSRKTDPNEKRQYQDRSALHLACGYGQLAVVEELLKAGADPDTKSRMGRTPLHEACQGGYQDVLGVLLDYTRKVNTGDIEGQTPSHLAAFNGEVECLEMLLEKGASLVSEDRLGRTAAHLAATRNHRKVLEFLYEKGIDLDCPCDNGKLPLHFAAQQGALDSIVCLIERDCDITIGDNHGNLPIHFAACKNRLECVRFLVKQGSSVVATQGEGKTPAHVAAYHGACKVLHWLMEKKVPVDVKDAHGNTPSHYAAEAGKAKCFGCLLYHGADLQTPNMHGDTPLDAAKKAGNSILIEKAVNGEVVCKDCAELMKMDAWNQKYASSPVLKSMKQLKTQAYSNPLPKLKYTPQGYNTRQTNKNGQFPKRDPSTKYFGEYLQTELQKLKFT